MKLAINSKYQLRGDDSQWIVEYRTEKDGLLTDRFVVMSYHPTLSGAVNALVEHNVRTSDATSLSEALDAVSKITQDITSALCPHFTISISSNKARR